MSYLKKSIFFESLVYFFKNKIKIIYYLSYLKKVVFFQSFINFFKN